MENNEVIVLLNCGQVAVWKFDTADEAYEKWASLCGKCKDLDWDYYTLVERIDVIRRRWDMDMTWETFSRTAA